MGQLIITETAINSYEARRIFTAEMLKTISIEVTRSEIEVLDQLLRHSLVSMPRSNAEDRAFFYDIFQLWLKKIEPKTLSLNKKFALKFNISEAFNVLKYIDWCDEQQLAIDAYTFNVLTTITQKIHPQLL